MILSSIVLCYDFVLNTDENHLVGLCDFGQFILETDISNCTAELFLDKISITTSDTVFLKNNNKKYICKECYHSVYGYNILLDECELYESTVDVIDNNRVFPPNSIQILNSFNNDHFYIKQRNLNMSIEQDLTQALLTEINELNDDIIPTKKINFLIYGKKQQQQILSICNEFTLDIQTMKTVYKVIIHRFPIILFSQTNMDKHVLLSNKTKFKELFIIKYQITPTNYKLKYYIGKNNITIFHFPYKYYRLLTITQLNLNSTNYIQNKLISEFLKEKNNPVINISKYFNAISKIDFNNSIFTVELLNKDKIYFSTSIIVKSINSCQNKLININQFLKDYLVNIPLKINKIPKTEQLLNSIHLLINMTFILFIVCGVLLCMIITNQIKKHIFTLK